MANTRASAATALDQIITRGRSLKPSLETALKIHNDARDRAFVQELVYGVCRWWLRLEKQISSLLNKPLRARDQDIRFLIACGLYQLQFLQTPAHAAVKETVDAVIALNKSWARGLVNGCLRSALRDEHKLTTIIAESAEATYAHPAWLIDYLKTNLTANAEEILTANNTRPPLTLRVNRRLGSRDRYLNENAERLSDLATTKYSPVGVILAKPLAVDQIPGFRSGEVSVQDEAAQFAAELLCLDQAQHILDACAAPGGKTGHIAESMPDSATLVALDHDPCRAARIDENLARLGLSSQVIVGDAGAPKDWWDSVPFDRILVDAPCSGSGVLRRHPDIKFHRTPTDIASLKATQIHLLNALWPLLKPAGILVYATCSILDCENDQVIEEFVAQANDVAVQEIHCEWGNKTRFGRQTYPGDQRMDGFYYARLMKPVA